VIDMTKGDPEAVESTLLYLYTPKYPRALQGTLQLTQSNTTASHLGRAGNKTQIAPGLKWSHHLTVFKVADKLVIQELRCQAKAVLRKMVQEMDGKEYFFDLLKELWDSEQSDTQEPRDTALELISISAVPFMDERS
jgi:hypothetical protein